MLPILKETKNCLKLQKYLKYFNLYHIPVFIRGSFIYSNNPFDLDIIIIKNKQYEKNYNFLLFNLQNDIKLNYNLKLDILELELYELNNYYNFLIKHKSVPLNNHAKVIFGKIKNYNFSEIPKKNYENINFYLQNFKNSTKAQIFISKKILRALYEKYLNNINIWAMDLKYIYILLKKTNLTKKEYELIKICNKILKTKNKINYCFNKIIIS